MASTAKNTVRVHPQTSEQFLSSIRSLDDEGTLRSTNHKYADSTRYPGGKNQAGAYQTIINQIPDCHTLIEGCCGSGSLIRKVDTSGIKRLGIEINPTQAFKLQTELNHVHGIYIQQGDILEYLSDPEIIKELFSNPGVFLYLDPPYPYECRLQGSKPVYGEWEWPDTTHRKLMKLVKNPAIKCMVMISSYHNSIYDKALAKWRQVEYTVFDRGHNKKTEVLYMNYPEPTELASYKYIGTDYRDRWNIKSKILRRIKGIENLPQHERVALLKAISEKWGIELDRDKLENNQP